MNGFVHIKTCNISGLLEDILHHLEKPLFGLAKSGNDWDRTLIEHITSDFGTNYCVIDEILFYKYESEMLVQISAICFNKALHEGKVN